MPGLIPICPKTCNYYRNQKKIIITYDETADKFDFVKMIFNIDAPDFGSELQIALLSLYIIYMYYINVITKHSNK
jgi:hypothetical protein